MNLCEISCSFYEDNEKVTMEINRKVKERCKQQQQVDIVKQL